jgi:NADH-quinone oxidoreductase subunit A
MISNFEIRISSLAVTFPRAASGFNCMADFLPILLFVIVAAAVSCAMLIGPRLLAPRKRTAVKEMPYESGMDPIHDTRRRFAVRFHLVAIAFLVFDVELLFLYPWAVALRQGNAVGNAEWGMGNGGQLANSPLTVGGVSSAARGIDLAVSDGWISSRGLVFAGAMVFILLVVLGFVYDWRKGVFKWR